MYRELRGEAELKTPMRVCFVTVDEECSEDSAFYTTTSSMRAVANYHSYSIGMTAGLGWTYRLGEKLEIALVPIGLYIPLHTVRKVDSKLFPVSDQVGGDGLQQEVNNSVGKASAKAESLMREQVDEKADLIERLPVPWARISIAYQLH